MNGEATSEWAEAVLMMRPHFCAFMPGIAARIAWNGAERLMAMMASHLSVGKSSIGETCWMPALLTRMSSDPILALGVGDHGRDLRPLRHVGRVVESLDPEFLLDLGALGLDRRLVAEPVDDDVRSLLGEGAGDRQANAARRTGDKGVTFGERHRRFSSSDRGQTGRAERSYCIAVKLSRDSLHCKRLG